MPQTVEVRFKGTRREFYTWADDAEPLRLKEAVIVQLERGSDLGRVHTAGETAEKKCGSCASCATGEQLETAKAGGTPVASSDTADAESAPPGAPPGETPGAQPSASPSLRPILRRASQEDLKQSNDLRLQEEDVRRQVVLKVKQHKLEMKVSDAEWQWDRAKLTVYFTAEKRVDFRALVRELASQFRARIELRQIGVRDEAARLTGVGRCGREYCCSTWLTDLSPVSLALAKDQHLSLNPSQISGGCGRLLCCLRYEHEFYVTSRKRYPREGKMLTTSLGSEKVIAVDIFRERVFLRGEEGSRIIPLLQLQEEMASPAVGAIAATIAEAPSRRAAEPPRSEPRVRRPAERRPEGPSRAAAEPRPSPLESPASEPSRAAAEPPSRPTAEPPEAEAQKRRRRRGRRGRGGGGGGAKPQDPTTPPEG
jgi:cell fate regulator YaaT (PSP1 superfamily)